MDENTHAVTVGELIRSLEKFPEDFPVILSKDAEGNDFHGLDEVASGRAVDPQAYSVEFYDAGEDNVVILWPW